jgi:hypothetical protein
MGEQTMKKGQQKKDKTTEREREEKREEERERGRKIDTVCFTDLGKLNLPMVVRF